MSADLDRVTLDHTQRGIDAQLGLRGLLVVFVGLTLMIVPPIHDRAICLVIVVVYALFAIAYAWWARGLRARPAQLTELALFVDLAVVATLTLVTGIAAQQSWTADILINGLFMLPLLACTQLRPGVCTAVVVPTVAVFFATSWVTKESNDEPWSSILLSTLALAGVASGAIVLCVIQRSRVRTISRLVAHRSALLSEVVEIEGRERAALSEQLHDGALQLVLAARLDAQDLRETNDPAAIDRLTDALTECAVLLRTAVSELHPAVLQALGPARALTDLARSVQDRGRLSVELDVSGWTDGLRTTVDGLLFSTARELLSNVVKHAHADTVWVELSQLDHRASLIVADDGHGFSAAERSTSLQGGHIGLASHELRIVAAGGTFSIRPRSPSGTEVAVEIPFDIL